MYHNQKSDFRQNKDNQTLLIKIAIFFFIAAALLSGLFN